MTAKRFTITQDFEEHHRQIRDNGKIIMGCFLEPQAEPIVKLLNELHEENQSSKEFIEQLQEELVLFKNAGADMGIDLNNQITALKKENEQLKEALKNKYWNEICENCKHGKYERDWYGEGEFECLKKHFGNDDWKCDGLKECDDFELDLKRFLDD